MTGRKLAAFNDPEAVIFLLSSLMESIFFIVFSACRLIEYLKKEREFNKLSPFFLLPACFRKSTDLQELFWVIHVSEVCWMLTGINEGGWITLQAQPWIKKFKEKPAHLPQHPCLGTLAPLCWFAVPPSLSLLFGWHLLCLSQLKLLQVPCPLGLLLPADLVSFCRRQQHQS